ncbi:hydrogenase expression/formation protein HypE [Microbulbifer salipaludis]|uniref:hydrogenase expression/formation protein HypE n=1 Tax=Microbulbifer salipaludis TaxID=187980 RepID=UPI001F5D86D8|nr:hydrogenase expression/formation protein HypE [Microbulbifer salipaludis]
MNIECPLPMETLATDSEEMVRLGHGSGGELTERLLQNFVFPYIDNRWIQQGHDSATLPLDGSRLVFTTDSFVVSPLFFPGGNIGTLAVYGTVNDLAMSGARPKYLSCGLILEEGLPLKQLARIMQSMGRAAAEVGVQLVTGDTKVVEKGKGDGVYINTSGIGVLAAPQPIHPRQIAASDAIILSGDIGRHGMAVMAAREGLDFENPLHSDCAPLCDPVMALLAAAIDVHCLRDLTRGGLATALVELAESSHMQMQVHEDQIPVTECVQGACELLGLDPMYVANEGRFLLFVPANQQQAALEILQAFDVSAGSRVIGEVIGLVDDAGTADVILSNALGSERLLCRLPGEQLPRIC